MKKLTPTTNVKITSFNQYLYLLIFRELSSSGVLPLSEVARMIHVELLANQSEEHQVDKISLAAKAFLKDIEILIENSKP